MSTRSFGEGRAGVAAGMLRRTGRKPAVVSAIVLAASAFYLLQSIGTKWVPHDEGTLGHSAERVLQGELPHRDFDALYTGGLCVLHAASLQLFGDRLLSLRIPLLLSALVFLLAVHRIGMRVASPVASGLVALCCLVWSFPNYPAPMPSWYNLIFATLGLWALLRHAEEGSQRWALLAGACGGVSFLMKQTGLYFAVAALLYFVYAEQARRADSRSTPSAGIADVAVVVGLSALVLALAFLFLQGGTLMGFVYFAIPGTLPAACLAWRQGSLWRRGDRSSAKHLWKPLAAFAAGFVVPVSVFLIPYLATSSMNDWLYGVFVLPGRRLGLAPHSLAAATGMLAALPVAALLAAGFRDVSWLRRPAVIGLGVALCLAVVGVGDRKPVYLGVWDSLRMIMPLTAAVGCALLCSRHAPRDPARAASAFAVVVVAAMTSLVQFPNALGIYFCYGAPLLILAVLFVVQNQPHPPTALNAVLLGAYSAFALVWLNSGSILTFGSRYLAFDYATLEGRAGLDVPSQHVAIYEWMEKVVWRHSRPGQAIYATPDAPEVYFLTRRANPTRTLSDVFDEDYADAAARSARLLAMLDAKEVPVVVIKRPSEFSRVDPSFLEGLVDRYPKRYEAPVFTVYVRKGPRPSR